MPFMTKKPAALVSLIPDSTNTLGTVSLVWLHIVGGYLPLLLGLVSVPTVLTGLVTLQLQFYIFISQGGCFHDHGCMLNQCLNDNYETKNVLKKM